MELDIACEQAYVEQLELQGRHEMARPSSRQAGIPTGNPSSSKERS